jgi:5-methylcytosine-specific restriction endonuclease McrA
MTTDIVEYRKMYREKNKEKIAIKRKIWNGKNREYANSYNRKWRLENHEHVLNCNRLWRLNNKDKVRAHWEKSYEKNKIKARARAVKRYHELYKKGAPRHNPVYAEKYRAQYYKLHKDELLRKNKEYRLAHIDECRKRVNDYRKQNPMLIKMHHQKRRAMIKNGGILLKKTIQMVYEDNIKKHGTLTCYLCNKTIVFGKDQLEHKTPLSRNGTNEYSNLAISCQKCNFEKHSKTEDEYINFIIGGK